jgi:hypothetical protein
MATDTRGQKVTTEQTESKTTVQGDTGRSETTTASSQQQVLSEPVYYRTRKKKKGKGRKRYTKGTKPFQKLLFGAARAGYRTANAFAEGFDTFAKRSNRSSRKRKDGLIRDSLRNASRAFSDGAREAGKAPGQIAKQIGTNNVRRGFRVLFNPFAFGR